METTWVIFKLAGQGKLGWIISSQKFLYKGKKLDAQATAWPGYMFQYLIKLTGISATDFFPIKMVAEQVTSSFAVTVDFLTVWIVIMTLWQTEYFR